MSERQRLITKYSEGLFPPMKVKYHLHFFRSETDPGAKETLRQKLAEESLKSDQISAAQERRSTVFGLWNPSLRGNVVRESPDRLLDTFQIERAVEEYELSKRHDSQEYLRERILCLFILDRIAEAMELVEQGDYDRMIEIAMMVCFSAKKWKQAMKWGRRYANKLGSRVREQNPLVTEWGGAHLLALAILATEQCEKVGAFLAKLERCSIDLSDVREILELFENRDFLGLWSRKSIIQQWVADSLSASVVAQPLFARIQQNITENAVRPYASIRLIGPGSVEEEIGFDPTQFLMKGIEEGNVAGKIDFVEMMFLTHDNDIETWKYIYRTVSCREKFEDMKWLHSYKHA